MGVFAKVYLRSRLVAIIGISITMVSACGDLSVRKAKVRKGSKYSYEYAENGCSTGRQTFYSLEDYCRGLQDEELNQGCAASQRDGTSHLLLSPHEFLEKLAAITPPPKSHLVRWGGVFAANSPFRKEIVLKPEEKKGFDFQDGEKNG